ncbi:MAG: hypothetical protein J7K39_06310 [Bacteroidales bacterium]|nr:hypothetical protein [Bacteroidales bacterium]
MPRVLYYFLSLFFYVLVIPVSAQELSDDTPIYGLNPILHNGKVYSYFPGDQVKGHQYFKQKAFSKGCVSIRGIKYENILLNYDILNQEVVLQYTDPQGSNRLLAVSKAWLEKFSISNEQFSLINTPDGHKLIVQTLNQGKIQLHNHWTTRIIAEISFVAEHYTFEKKRNTLFISYENKLKKFNSTKDILNLFNNENKLKIKRYLKQNKLKARRNSLNQLIGLINYCNQL